MKKSVKRVGQTWDKIALHDTPQRFTAPTTESPNSPAIARKSGHNSTPRHTALYEAVQTFNPSVAGSSPAGPTNKHKASRPPVSKISQRRGANVGQDTGDDPLSVPELDAPTCETCGTVLHPGKIICDSCSREADEMIKRATGRDRA